MYLLKRPVSIMAASVQYRVMWISLVILCIIGMLTSFYAYYVEISKEKDSSYIAACDISEYISCSKVFTSKYGKGFGLIELLFDRTHWLNQPNSVYGVIFYCAQILLSMRHNLDTAQIQTGLSVVANIGSVYLAYILYFVLGDFCIVCVTTYIVNFIILLTNLLKISQINEIIERRRRQLKAKTN